MSVSHGQDTLLVCLGSENPHRLVSLWDMVRAYGNYIAGLTSILVSFNHISAQQFARDESGKWRPQEQAFIGSTFENLKQAINILPVLGLSQSSIYAKRLLETWEKYGFDVVQRDRMLEVLHGRIMDELKSTFFMYLSIEKAALYQQPMAGWEEVVSKFPESQTDIEEMNRCLAFSRYPAAVFHSVNAIEVGLISLGTFLGVDDPKSGWTAVSGKLEQFVVRTKFADLAPKYQKSFPFLEQVHGTVVGLKNAWRNKISHAQGRLVLMTPDFMPDVTDEIVVASRSFMRRLATEMP